MELQIHQAVEIALSGTSDPNLKNQAFEFITQIKSSEEGYKSCLDILTNSATINNNLKFFIYQVLDENLEKLTNQQLFELNSKLFKVLLSNINTDAEDPVFLRNKLAQIFGKLFCFVYLTRSTFWKELDELLNTNKSLAVDYYTRIVMSVHYEIGDKFISRSKEIQDRNTLLKDAIRANDMNGLVNTWFKILSNPNQSEDILNNTLMIVGQYITWMEIGLFISQDYILSILQYLKLEPQRNETCVTLIEIISKKMKPSNKLELIGLLDLTVIINNSIDISDVTYMENISKLTNQIGTELLLVLEAEPELVQQINLELYKLWPLVFDFISHEFDDVSQHVFPFIQAFLLLCKRIPSINSMEIMLTLLNKVILKMKYDDDDDGENDDDDEQFREIRSKLKNIQDSIAVLKPELYLQAIPIVVNESIFNNDEKSINWRKLELGIFELNSFSESLRNNLINVPKSEINQSKPHLIFQEFLIKLINSDFIININHPKVQIGFFEIIVKHYNFLNTTPSHEILINRILEIFTSPYGLFNELEKVRLRSWYFFFRFVKLTKPVLSNEQFIESLILKLRPLLAIKAELPTKDEDDEVVENGNFNNQLYLFETIGLLIALMNSNLLPFKMKLIDLIFQPLFNDLEGCVGSSEQEKLNQPVIALQAHHSLMAIGTIVRGFDYEFQSKYNNELITKINNAAQVVLITLENFPKHEIIRDAARFAFARFIPILNNHIHIHLTKLVTLILSANNLKITELTDFLSFLVQIVHNFQNDDTIYQLLNNLLSPTFNKIFEMLATEESATVPDVIRNKNQLRKAYMNFLSSLVLNHASSLLITETNKHKFPEVITSLFDYAYDLSETSVTKLAIIQLTNIVNIFGNGGKINDAKDKYSDNLGAVDGIDAFLMDKVTQLSFELPFKNQEFDLKDAQYRLIAQEISVLLKTYQERKGDEYLNYLVTYLSNMGLSQELMNDFGTNLVKLDSRGFKKYFVGFVTGLK